MTKYWSRDNTKEWISQLENRIEDIEYYLAETLRWCEDNEIYDNQKVTACCFLTCIWVAHMRDEQITFTELCDILCIENDNEIEDKIYDLGPKLKDLDHVDLLNLIAGDFRKFI